MKSRTIYIKAHGIELTLAHWSEITGQPYGRLYARVSKLNKFHRTFKSFEDMIQPLPQKANEFWNFVNFMKGKSDEQKTIQAS